MELRSHLSGDTRNRSLPAPNPSTISCAGQEHPLAGGPAGVRGESRQNTDSIIAPVGLTANCHSEVRPECELQWSVYAAACGLASTCPAFTKGDHVATRQGKM